MKIDLDEEELNFILESLEYSKQRFENYDNYPSREFQEGRIKFVIDLKEKLKSSKNALE